MQVQLFSLLRRKMFLLKLRYFPKIKFIFSLDWWRINFFCSCAGACYRDVPLAHSVTFWIVERTAGVRSRRWVPANSSYSFFKLFVFVLWNHSQTKVSILIFSGMKRNHDYWTKCCFKKQIVVKMTLTRQRYHHRISSIRNIGNPKCN